MRNKAWQMIVDQSGPMSTYPCTSRMGFKLPYFEYLTMSIGLVTSDVITSATAREQPPSRRRRNPVTVSPSRPITGETTQRNRRFCTTQPSGGWFLAGKPPRSQESLPHFSMPAEVVQMKMKEKRNENKKYLGFIHGKRGTYPILPRFLPPDPLNTASSESSSRIHTGNEGPIQSSPVSYRRIL